MQRISFDFMTRRIRQFRFETIRRAQRNKRTQTVEEVVKRQKQAEFEAQFVPLPQRGHFFGIFGHESVPQPRDSRQVRRYKVRMVTFNEISQRYPGEPRRIRRSIAFDLVRNRRKARAA